MVQKCVHWRGPWTRYFYRTYPLLGSFRIGLPEEIQLSQVVLEIWDDIGGQICSVLNVETTTKKLKGDSFWKLFLLGQFGIFAKSRKPTCKLCGFGGGSKTKNFPEFIKSFRDPPFVLEGMQPFELNMLVVHSFGVTKSLVKAINWSCGGSYLVVWQFSWYVRRRLSRQLWWWGLIDRLAALAAAKTMWWCWWLLSG